jgi:predicted DNA-binding WGR domain protein
MTAVTLHRTDQARHMRRFYLLGAQPDLFGNWSFVREWGRIGGPGRVRIDPYLSISAEAGPGISVE